MTEIAAISGSVARAARIIDVLKVAPQGLALNQIVALSEFTKTTAFRVLANLQDVGYVFQDPESRKYLLGQKLAHISQIASRIDTAAIATRGLDRLAALTGDTIFLSVPEGASAICVSRVTGDYPIRTLTLNQGDSRPLGVGAGSLALYCASDEERRASVRRVNRNWLAEFGVTSSDLDDDYTAYQKNGYATNSGRIVQGTSAVAVPVITQCDRLIGAIAIGAIDARMTLERINKLLIPALRQEANYLATRMEELEQG